MNYLIFIAFILIQLNYGNSQDPCLPLWPRIEFGNVFSDNTSEQKMVIKFNTKDACSKSFVTVSDRKGTIHKVYCESSLLKLSTSMKNYQTNIQRCSISDINLDEQVSYIAYGANKTSGVSIPYDMNPINTSIFDPNTSRSLTLLTLADWSEVGDKNYTSLNMSLDKIRSGQKIDGILIGGDYAYDLDSNNGKNYQKFLAILSRIGKYVPVLLQTGNHEHNSADDLTIFYGSFENFEKNTKLAFGLNMGPFFYAGFDPYQVLYPKSQIRKQIDVKSTQSYLGLKQMLERGKLNNKTIITNSHYPLMCSALVKNCEKDKVLLKDYFDLMFDYGVQFYIGAHYHVYERIYPYCQNGTIQKISSPYDLKSEKCIVSIIQGIAGNSEKIVETYDKLQQFTATVSFGQTGFGKLTVNPNSLFYQHYSTENLLTITDKFQMRFTENSNKNVNFQTAQQ